jgi:hypothetical protein
MRLRREIDRIVSLLEGLQRMRKGRPLQRALGRQDFLILRSGHQLLLSRAGLQRGQPLASPSAAEEDRELVAD